MGSPQQDSPFDDDILKFAGNRQEVAIIMETLWDEGQDGSESGGNFFDNGTNALRAEAPVFRPCLLDRSPIDSQAQGGSYDWIDDDWKRLHHSLEFLWSDEKDEEDAPCSRLTPMMDLDIVVS